MLLKISNIDIDECYCTFKQSILFVFCCTCEISFHMSMLLFFVRFAKCTWLITGNVTDVIEFRLIHWFAPESSDCSNDYLVTSDGT